jgi:hypothetical protein
MFLAVRSWPQEWSSTETSEIFDAKIIHYCGVGGTLYGTNLYKNR